MSTATKLQFYGLYKQATKGDCNLPKPSFFNIPGRRKWTAWNHNRGMDPDEAQRKYITAVEELQEMIHVAAGRT